MSKSRKVLGALLAVVMVISMLSVCAFAVGDTFYEDAEDAAKYTQSWSLGTPVSQGGTTYTVQVMLSTNYPVGPVAFRLEGANVTGVVGGSEYYLNPLTTTSDTGMVLMIPDTTDTVPAVSVNGHIATVTYTTNNANGVVTIAADPKNAENPGGSLVAARCTAGTVNASNFAVGQTASVSGQVVTPPAGGETPVLSGVNGAVIDDSKGYVYGIPAATANVATYLSASASGVIEITANAAGAKNGTGATITLYNSTKTEVIKSYTLIIFGDVDGDGVIGLPDAGIIQSAANYVTAGLEGVIAFAADVDSDGVVGLPDAGIVQSYANYVTPSITVNPWAKLPD